MKPLSIEETKLKEEMKANCLANGQYIDEKAKEKFKMLCHLEDFEVIYWNSQQENEKLTAEKNVQKEMIENFIKENQQLKIQISAREEEHMKLESNWDELKEWLEKHWQQSQDIWFVKIINKMQEIERGRINE